MTYQDIVISQPLWPKIIYHMVSIGVFVLLLRGKAWVTRQEKRPLFILYTLLVPGIASVHFGLFRYGTAFARGFLNIDLDFSSDSFLWYSALFYSLIYLLAMPKNIFVKYV